MDLKRAEALAADLMKLHNVGMNRWLRDGKQWVFKWDDEGFLPYGICGITMFDRSVIMIDPVMTEDNPEWIFKEVLLHELAHTKVNPFLAEDHGPVWKAMAYSMGCEASVPLGGMPPGTVKHREPSTVEDYLSMILGGEMVLATR